MRFFMKWPALLLPLILVSLGPSLVKADALEDSYRAAVKANPKNASAHFNLGVIYFNQNNYADAISEFKTCLQLDPGDSQAKELLESSQGVSAYFQGDFHGAVDHLEKAVRVNPKNQNANMLLGNAYLKLGQYEKAEKALRQYAETAPTDAKVQAKANEGLGNIHLEQKDYASAVKDFEKVVSADPKNLSALQNLGYCHFQTKDYGSAAKAWERSAKVRKDPQTLKFLGFAYYNLGDFQSAISNYNKSIRSEESKDPKEQDRDSLAETYYNLAVAYNDNGLYDEAAESFGQAFKINPKDSNAALGQGQAIDAATNAHMEKASSYFLSNRYSQAISEWKRVLAYQPNNAQAKGFIQDAQSKLQDEVQRLYESGRSNANRGNSLAALTDWKQALQMDPENEKLKKAIKGLEVKKKDQVKALLAEGDALNAAGDYSAALDAYQQASKIDKKNTLVRSKLKNIGKKRTTAISADYGLGMKAYGKGDLKSALKHLQAAKEINPNDPKVQTALFKVQKDITVRVKTLNEEGVSLFNSGDKEGAKKKFNEVLKYKSSDETANDYVKRMTGQQSVQKADAEKVKALYYEGVNLYINGKIHEAIDKWQECLKQDPGNINAQNNIKKAQLKLRSIEQLSKN